MINDISSINRIMSIIEDLKIKDNTSNEENVEKEYLRNYFLPIIDDYCDVVEFCISIKLLSNVDSRIIITPFGEEFLSLNPATPYRRYEVNQVQKQYLIYRIISCELYQNKVQELIRKFNLNEGGELSSDNAEKDQNTKKLLDLLEKLDFLHSKEDSLIIDEEYENELIVYGLNEKTKTLDKFLEGKMEEAIRGNIAERYVLEFEMKRLSQEQNKNNAGKINLVSLQNVYAGYDIASFDSGDSEEFDRFIEVKSSQYHKVHFFISKNEIKKARQESDKYWLYYVKMKGRKPIKLQIFRNPIETIIKNEKRYDVESSQLEVTEK